MGRYEIKLRLLKLAKTQMDLLFEVRKRGYPRLQYPSLNSYISGKVVTPQAETVLKMCDGILSEWEASQAREKE